MRSAAVALLLAACSPVQPPTEPSPRAEPVASATALEVLALPSASAAAPPAVARWKAGDVLKHMPPRCDYGRAYVNVDELLGGAAKAELARLAQKKLGESERVAGLAVFLEAFEKAGKNPYTAVKELGICFEKSEEASVAAVRIDLSGIDAPAEVLARAIEAKEGKPPKVDNEGGFVWLERSDGRVAAVGENLIVLGYARDTVAAGLGGSLIPPEFADAPRHLVWARVRDKDSSLRVSAIGDDLDVHIETEVGPSAASIASSFQALLPQLETMMTDPKQAPLRPLLPAARRASISANGERIVIATRMPKAVVREVLQGLVDSPGL